MSESPRSEERGIRGSEQASAAATGADVPEAARDRPPTRSSAEPQPPAEDTGTSPAAARGQFAAESDQGAAFIPRVTIGAFANDSGVRSALEEAASDRRMMRATLEIHEGEIDAAAAHYTGHPTPDLILVETRLEYDTLIRALERLAEHCPPGTRLIVVGHRNDIALYRQLMKFGVADYLVAPLRPLAVIDAIAQLFQASEAVALGKVVAFIGARGGAGSSTVAQNVAAAMAGHCQTSVLLVDLDLCFGTAALDLNLEPTQTVLDALEAAARLDKGLLDRLVTQRNERMAILAAPCQLDLTTDHGAETFAAVIEAARAVAPHLLLDLPHGWSPETRQALQIADEVVVTTTPDLAALRNARNLAAALRAARRNDPPPLLVLNKMGLPKRREVSAADFQRVLEVEPVAQIPHAALAFSAAAASGQPVIESRSHAAAADAFQALAVRLTGRKAARATRRGLAGLARRLTGAA